MLAFVAGTTARAQEPASNFQYDLNEACNGIVIKKYTGSNRNLVIPRTIEGYPVVEVRGNMNFPRWMEDSMSNTSLISVVIPEGVRVIDKGAFAHQKNLTSVTLPSTLEYIGYRSF